MHFPCFDGLRAFAALSVVGVHTAFSSGFDGRHGVLGHYAARLEIGVSVFFVISGFLLYRPFAADHFAGGNGLDRRKFWIRRLKRIIPAYWLAFIVITYVMHADTVRHAWFSPLIYLGFAQIYFPHYVLSGLLQAWSLCTEISFYLFLPLYAAVIGVRTADGRPDHGAQFRRELAGLGVLVAISLIWRIPILLQHSLLAQTMPNWLPGYLDVFALGMFLAVASSWLAASDRRPAWLWHPALPWISWALAAGAFVAVSNIGLSMLPVQHEPLGLSLAKQTLYELFGFFLVVPAVFGRQDRSLVRRALQWKPVALVGIVSYGVYLWHESWMILMLRWHWLGKGQFRFTWPDLYFPVAILAVGAATLSYRLVERPVLTGRAGRLAREALSAVRRSNTTNTEAVVAGR